MSITAILKLGILKAKVKLPNLIPEYKMILRSPIKYTFNNGSSLTMKDDTKVMVFECRKQISKNVFEYEFKEIV